MFFLILNNYSLSYLLSYSLFGIIFLREGPQSYMITEPTKLDLPLFPALLVDSCVILGKSLGLSVPPFPHL